jgi:DNA-binding SARP family transcriptional activator/predicted ATPase
MSTPTLCIRLFGPLELAWGDETLAVPSSLKARSLLAYLVLHHDCPISRDRLAGIFWPERPDTRARRALSQALWQIRSALGPAADHLVTERDAVTFLVHSDDRLDVVEFERLVMANQGPQALASSLTMAVELYRADFLEDIYDDWALVERERLRELYLGALERLITLQKQQGDYEQALVCAQRLSAADPLREAAHRELMRLYHLLGRSEAALEQFAALRDLLAEELGVPPAPATVALYQEIVAALEDAAPPHLPVATLPPPLLRDLAHLPLVGRTNERAALLYALQTAIQGHGGQALIEGDAGVGKTRLVSEIVSDAEWRGFQVGLGKADPSAAVAPYQVLREALSPLLSPLRIAQLAELMEPVWLSAVASLFPAIAQHLPDLPALAPLVPQEEQRRLWEGLARCLAGLATVAPHLLILEDLHWADEGTLMALPYLSSRLQANRLCIILTCRTAEARERVIVWETLDTLDRTLPLLRLRLLPFERAETEALIARALGTGVADRQADTFAHRLQDETGGNALFLVETLKSLLEQGVLALSPGGEWVFPVDDQLLSTPTSVQELVGQRLGRLAPALRSVLEQVAVLGENADFAVLSCVSDVESSALPPALEELKQRGFLAETKAGYRFPHDRVQEIAYRAISPERRLQLHRQAGAALEALHPDRVEALAHHSEHGQVLEKAVHYYWQAGERAAALHAYPDALHHYDRAVTLADTVNLSASRRFALLAVREATLDVLGRREEQASTLEVMERLAQDDPQRLVQVYQRQAWLLLHTGRYVEAEEMAQQALALARRLGDEAQQAKALTAFGTATYQRGDMPQAVPTLEAAIALYRRLGDLRGEAEAHRALAAALHGTGAYTDARDAITAALARYEALDDKVGQAESLVLFGSLHMEQGDSDEAIACYRQALEIGRAIGYRYEQAKSLTNLGNALYFQGRLAEALRYYDEAIAVFTSIDERRGEAFVRANAATVRHMTLGDDEAAARDAEAALAFYTEVGDRAGEGQCLDTLGGIALRRGELATARRYWVEALAAMQAAGDRWGEISLRRSLIELALKEDCPQLALEHLEKAMVLCQALDLADRATVLQADRGAILLALGQPAAALAATTQAMAQLKPGVEQAYLVPFIHHQVLTTLDRTDEAGDAIGQAYSMLSQALRGLSPEQREMSLERVPEHRAIVAAWTATQPQRATFRLPRADAPTGRPLRDDEWMEVSWTIVAPGDEQVSGEAWPELSRRVACRRHRLLRLLREAAEQSAAPTVAALAIALGLSERTVKRDLAALRAEGHDVHTRGARV